MDSSSNSNRNKKNIQKPVKIRKTLANLGKNLEAID